MIPVSIGFGCYIMLSQIEAIASPKSSPVRRMIKAAKASQTLVDLTYGHQVKTLIITKERTIYLSAVAVTTITARIVEAGKGNVKRSKKKGPSVGEPVKA